MRLPIFLILLLALLQFGNCAPVGQDLIPVPTLEQAYKRIQLGSDSLVNAAYYLEDSQQILFRVTDEVGKSIERNPPTGGIADEAPKPHDQSPSIPNTKRGIKSGIKKGMNRVPDSLDNLNDIQNEKMPGLRKISAGGWKKFMDNDGTPKRKPPGLKNKLSYWILQKIEDVKEEQSPELFPVTPCLDSINGDGGSISFSHGYAFAPTFRVERTFSIGYYFFLQSKKSTTKGYTKSHLYTLSGTVPKGYKGQVFVKNPKMQTAMVTQKLITLAENVKDLLTFKYKASILDYGETFEYHFLTSDKYQLQCDVPRQLSPQ